MDYGILCAERSEFIILHPLSYPLKKQSSFILVTVCMKTYTLFRNQTLNCTLEEAWHFFSSPENLDLLTPDDMKFKILTEKPIPKIFEGQIIQYKVHPILNIPLYWETKITKVKEKQYFTDNQIKGPYKLWNHTHRFEEHNGKVIMTDELKYALPGGPLGRLAHKLFIKSKLEAIFNFRFKKVEALFNDKSSE